MFAKKTVASVLTAFNKALDDLKNVEEEAEREAARQAQLIEEARAAHNAAIKEASLARDVSVKLLDLVSPNVTDMTVAELAKECA